MWRLSCSYPGVIPAWERAAVSWLKNLSIRANKVNLVAVAPLGAGNATFLPKAFPSSPHVPAPPRHHKGGTSAVLHGTDIQLALPPPPLLFIAFHQHLELCLALAASRAVG